MQPIVVLPEGESELSLQPFFVGIMKRDEYVSFLESGRKKDEEMKEKNVKDEEIKVEEEAGEDI